MTTCCTRPHSEESPCWGPLQGVAGDRYAKSAAEGMLHSLEHYGHTSPPVGDGRVSTPAWFANRLGKVMLARGDVLPGDAGEWWGARYAKYAEEVLGR